MGCFMSPTALALYAVVHSLTRGILKLGDSDKTYKKTIATLREVRLFNLENEGSEET